MQKVYRVCDLSRSLHWLMRIGGRPVTSTHTGAGEPVAGVWRGGLGCHWIVATSTRVCVLTEVPPDRRREGDGRLAKEGEGRDGGYVRPGRRARCRQGDGDGVPTHAQPEGPAARGDAHIQNDNRVVAGDAGLAGRGWGEHRGDGVHVGVLEGAVLLPRRSHGRVAAERGAHEGRAGPQE